MRVKLTEWTLVLAKPLRGTARGNFHIAAWDRRTMALCKVGIVDVYRVEKAVDADGATRIIDLLDEQGPAFTAGTARRAPSSEATCRRCRSILRHLPVTAFPIAVQHAVALAENTRIDAERAKAARKAERDAAARADAEGIAVPAARVAPAARPARETFRGHDRPPGGYSKRGDDGRQTLIFGVH